MSDLSDLHNSTVGYGTVVPSKQSSKIFAIITMCFGVASLAAWASSIANHFAEKRKAKNQQQIIDNALRSSEFCICCFITFSVQKIKLIHKTKKMKRKKTIVNWKILM